MRFLWVVYGNAGGMRGVADAERLYAAVARQTTVSTRTEDDMEGTVYSIYQAKCRDAAWVFEDSGFAARHGFSLEPYRLVWTSTIDGGHDEEVLERIYLRHNRDDRPDGAQARSLSMGDIVSLGGPVGGEGARSYYVDEIGFARLCGGLLEGQLAKEEA